MDKKIILNASQIDYQVDYRDIHYPRLEFRTGKLLLVLPRDYSNEENLLKNHSKWINEKLSKILTALDKSKKKKLNTTRTTESFKKKTMTITDNYLRLLKLEINGIRFRKMKSKWASCSKNGNITVNTLMKYLPEKNIRYVIYHELVHLKEKKHNRNFWNIISREFPEYKKMESDLFTFWFMIQSYGQNTINI